MLRQPDKNRIPFLLLWWTMVNRTWSFKIIHFNSLISKKIFSGIFHCSLYIWSRSQSCCAGHRLFSWATKYKEMITRTKWRSDPRMTWKLNHFERPSNIFLFQLSAADVILLISMVTQQFYESPKNFPFQQSVCKAIYGTDCFAQDWFWMCHLNSLAPLAD